jgi:peptidoglycan/LPS O-acetylase OafA/YrhL
MRWGTILAQIRGGRGFSEEIGGMSTVPESLPGPNAAAKKFELPRGTSSVHLDALRGLAAISVMFSHWWDLFFANYESVPRSNLLLSAVYVYGSFAHGWVIVFFVLSGYLVGGSVLRARRNGAWSWRTYLLTRCTRIYVVLLPALLFGCALDWAGMHQPGAEPIYSGKPGTGALYYDVYPGMTRKDFLADVFFLDIHRESRFGSNAPLWSLSHEFWYYIGFPFLVVAVTKSEKSWVRFANAFAVLAWAAFVGGFKLVLYLPWLAGVLIFFLPSLPVWRPWVRRLLVASGLTLLLVGFTLKARGLLFPDNSITLGRNHWHPPISDIVLSPVVVFLIWVLLHYATSPLQAVYVWLARHAAASSYTIYLVHMPALIFLAVYLRLPRAVPNWQSLPLRLALFAAVLLYAQGVYWLFERNTDKVRRWIKPLVLGTRRGESGVRAEQ